MSKTSRTRLWLDRLNRQSNSAETIAEFCKQEGVSTPSFYQWRRRLSPRIETPRKVRKRKRPSAADFSELIVAPASSVAQATLPGGVTLSLGNQPDIVAVIVDRLVRSCSAAAPDEIAETARSC